MRAAATSRAAAHHPLPLFATRSTSLSSRKDHFNAASAGANPSYDKKFYDDNRFNKTDGPVRQQQQYQYQYYGRGKIQLASVMAFLTGWSDVTLITHFKAFCTMLTGNISWLGLAVAEQRYVDCVFHLGITGFHLMGAAIFQGLHLVGHGKRSIKNNSHSRHSSSPVCPFGRPIIFVGRLVSLPFFEIFPPTTLSCQNRSHHDVFPYCYWPWDLE
jgi:hypothetical protein